MGKLTIIKCFPMNFSEEIIKLESEHSQGFNTTQGEQTAQLCGRKGLETRKQWAAEVALWCPVQA